MTIQQYFRFDIRNNRWSSVASMPSSRDDLCLVAFQGSLYAIGGDNAINTFDSYGDGDSEIKDTVDRYDPLTDRWFQDVPPMKTARTIHGCAIYKEKLYVAGGWNNTHGTLS